MDAPLVALPFGRCQYIMVDLAIQLVERAFMESQVQEAARLIANLPDLQMKNSLL